MPEIAEVALMADAIREIADGKQIIDIEVLGGKYKPYHIQDESGNWIDKIKSAKTGRMRSINPKEHPGGKHMVKLSGLNEIKAQMKHGTIKVNAVNVKGKYCWLDLSSNWFIGITFGMSGGIYYEPTVEVLNEYSQRTGKIVTRAEYMKHFHIKVVMNDNTCFYFGDMRRFGSWTISDQRSVLNKKLRTLGPDMLTSPPIPDQEFIRIFRTYNSDNICKVLMGQKAVSGIGNYMKAEVLYECRISPWANVSCLSDSTLIALHKAIREIARKAYSGHGASLYTYAGTRREKGSFQDILKVYGKSHDPEGRVVEVIAENKSPDRRTTHYVPSVQSEEHAVPLDPMAKKKAILKKKTKISLKKIKLKLKTNN